MTALLVAHILFTTSGYAGLIAANIYLLSMSASADAGTMRAALGGWQRSVRVFGPLLGLGILFGFGLAAELRISLVSTWLVATYALIIIGMGIQGVVVVPWQRRADPALALGTIPPLTPVRAMLVTQSVVYTAIVALMVLQPG